MVFILPWNYTKDNVSVKNILHLSELGPGRGIVDAQAIGRP